MTNSIALSRCGFLHGSGLTAAGAAVIAAAPGLGGADGARAAGRRLTNPFSGSIIYADSYQDRSKLTRVDGATGKRKNMRDRRTDMHPSIDPYRWDRIVCSSRLSQGWVLRIVHARGRFLETLTDETRGSAITPAWDPCGRFVAYTWVTGQEPRVRILDTEAKRNVFETADAGLAPTWSPWHGKSVSLAYFSNRGALGLNEIWQIDLTWNGGAFDGTAPMALTEAYVDDVNLDPPGPIEQKVPAWSPDGNHIAYWHGVEMDDPRPTGEVPRDVWIMNADGSGHRRLVNNSDDPFWSPDSADVGIPINIPLGPTTEPLAVGAVNPDGANERTLFYTKGNFVRATWSI